MPKNLKMPVKGAAPAPRTTMPRKPGAADLDATMVGRANKTQKPGVNTPVGRKTKR